MDRAGLVDGDRTIQQWREDYNSPAFVNKMVILRGVAPGLSAYAAEEKMRIVLEGLRGESIAELCRREGIASSMYYGWSKEFLDRDVGIEPQSTEPAIGQIEMDLLTQPTLRTNAEAVADYEHPDHQLRIDRWPPDVAIIGPQVRPNLGQVDKPVLRNK